MPYKKIGRPRLDPATCDQFYITFRVTKEELDFINKLYKKYSKNRSKFIKEVLYSYE